MHEQVAAYIGDGMLLGEGAIRLQNCAAPLLTSKSGYPMLRKALAACHLTLADIKASPAASIQVAVCASLDIGVLHTQCPLQVACGETDML